MSQCSRHEVQHDASVIQQLLEFGGCGSSVVRHELGPPRPGAYNLGTTRHNHAEVPMPQYEFYCNACKKTFTKILTLVDYEAGGVVCPHCRSQKVEQCWSVFSVITSKKSA
jgi:putative FmdB family regulatory protein